MYFYIDGKYFSKFKIVKETLEVKYDYIYLFKTLILDLKEIDEINIAVLSKPNEIYVIDHFTSEIIYRCENLNVEMSSLIFCPQFDIEKLPLVIT